jgi:hypothetical protein
MANVIEVVEDLRPILERAKKDGLDPKAIKNCLTKHGSWCFSQVSVQEVVADVIRMKITPAAQHNCLREIFGVEVKEEILHLLKTEV